MILQTDKSAEKRTSRSITEALGLPREATAAKRRVRLLLWEGWDQRVRACCRTLAAHSGVEVWSMPSQELEGGIALLDPELVRGAWCERRGSVVDGIPTTPVEISAAALAVGLVDGCVGGVATSTGDVLRAGIRYVGLGAGVKTVSVAFVVRGVSDRIVLLADCGAVIEPQVGQLVDIAAASVRTWTRIGRGEPRVAFLASSTKGSNRDPVNSKVQQALLTFREAMPHVAAEGELQGDAALLPEIAIGKGASRWSEPANILIMPSLNAGNIAVKLLQRLGNCESVAITQGFRRPFYDLSRSASVADALATSWICADECAG